MTSEEDPEVTDEMEARPQAPVLEIENLSIEARSSTGWSRIVNGVNLALRPGEVLGLVGESGAGKSTIGLAALGYMRPGARLTSGTVRFQGRNLFEMDEEARRAYRGTGVAYVAQSAAAAFNPAYRLLDQITDVAVNQSALTREQAVARAVELFAALQLPDPRSFGQRYPHQVSGGQLQRAMTAMAMICRPALIVFDEPTTALDVTTQVEVLISIRKVIDDYGVAAIYISHDLAVVAQMADRVAVLRYGNVVEEAPIARIMSRPEHPYTRTLWSVQELGAGETEGRLSTQEPLLQVRGLSAAYGKVEVLKQIDLDVARGETVALVGESGSGKSTLGRVIVGLKEPTRGEVAYSGRTLGATVSMRSREMLKKIQIIYQSADTALNPRQTVRKILGRPLTLYHGLRGRAREARTLALLGMVELDETYIDRMPGQLSGGQKQRVAIARALAAEPDLIICDEITSSLDKVVQAEILKMLMNLQAQLQVSYLFITHDLEVVRAISDRVIVLQHGRIVEQGLREEVFTAPQQEYTKILLHSVPEMAVGWLDELIEPRSATLASAR